MSDKKYETDKQSFIICNNNTYIKTFYATPSYINVICIMA